jgi:16S rRNA (cytidine1402-2'-O)-methyltransferase
VTAPGRLVLVGTPIGNLGDLAPRAAEALATADVVCCEDTRRTGKLLSLAGIERRPFVVVNEHTEGRETPRLLDRLARGERVVLVSDAGMPGVSDPGERLVAAAVAAGHPVEVVPGPSAALAGLVVSGLPAGRFVFEGFLPRKGAARTERLVAVGAEPRTVVLFEAPHRVARTLTDLVEACGPDRRVAVARELTKLHEEVWRGSLLEAAAWAADREPPGEIVLVVEGAPAAAPPDDEAVRDAVQAELAAGATARDAARAVADRLAVPRRRAYEIATRAPSPPRSP